MIILGLTYNLPAIPSNAYQDSVSLELKTDSILFIGMANPVKIIAEGYIAEKFDLKIDNGSIKKTDSGYSIFPQKKGIAIITVTYKDKVILTKKYLVRVIPDPLTVLNNFNEPGPYELTIQELIRAGGITSIVQEPLVDLHYKVVSFSVEALDNTGLTQIIRSDSNKFTKNQLELFRKVSQGRLIHINGVSAVGPDGAQRCITDISIKVK